jgi:hypothetical protein
VDPLTDRGFCGASGTCEAAETGEACNDEQVCSGGSCQTNCTGGTVLCDGTCVDPDYDPSYCGASGDCAGANVGAVCDDAVCDQGACRSECGPSNIVCGGSCVDPSVNPNFCGATGTCEDADSGDVCGAGEACVEGGCEPNCSEGQIVCNGRCINPSTTPNFCGASDTCIEGNAGRACNGNQSCLGGTCFEAGVIFVSPSNRRSDSTTPRGVVYTIDTLIPDVTVHYTVDGSEPVPGMGSTTTTTDVFQVGPLANDGEVRFVADVEGRLSPPEVLRANIQPTDQRGTIIENLQVDNQGPVARVTPGASVRITANIQYWKQNANGFCPGCVVQANISMEGVGRVGCFDDPGIRGFPGLTASINNVITAPDEPGDYVIAVTNPLDFSCSNVSTGYIGGTPVGIVQVRPAVRTPVGGI